MIGDRDNDDDDDDYDDIAAGADDDDDDDVNVDGDDDDDDDYGDDEDDSIMITKTIIYTFSLSMSGVHVELCQNGLEFNLHCVYRFSRNVTNLPNCQIPYRGSGLRNRLRNAMLTWFTILNTIPIFLCTHKTHFHH